MPAARSSASPHRATKSAGSAKWRLICDLVRRNTIEQNEFTPPSRRPGRCRMKTAQVTPPASMEIKIDATVLDADRRQRTEQTETMQVGDNLISSILLSHTAPHTSIGRAVAGIGLGSLVVPDRYSSTPAAQARPSAMAQTISDCPRPASPQTNTPSTLVA
jgi:hypothetical protein